MQKRTHDNKMTINYNKEDLRQKKKLSSATNWLVTKVHYV